MPDTNDPMSADSHKSDAPAKDKGRWKDSKGASALGAAGKSMSSSGQSMMDRSAEEASSRIGPVSFKRGGKTRKTGLARLHKGERVIPRGKVKRVEKMMRKSKMRMKASGRD